MCQLHVTWQWEGHCAVHPPLKAEGFWRCWCFCRVCHQHFHQLASLFAEAHSSANRWCQWLQKQREKLNGISHCPRTISDLQKLRDGFLNILWSLNWRNKTDSICLPLKTENQFFFFFYCLNIVILRSNRRGTQAVWPNPAASQGGVLHGECCFRARDPRAHHAEDDDTSTTSAGCKFWLNHRNWM